MAGFVPAISIRETVSMRLYYVYILASRPGGGAAVALIGKFPAEEVSSNLHRLKEVMETGTVTDTSYSVAGKIPRRPARPELTKQRR
jgi:hypothetical protein